MLRRLVAFLLAIVLLHLTSCTQSASEMAELTENAGKTVLRVLTETSTPDGMLSQIHDMAEQFEAAHDGVVIELEILPANGIEREQALSSVYMDLSHGHGPDIYLLPAGNTVSTCKEGYLTTSAPPAFEDVTKQMYDGRFADLSQYYDADSALNKEGLLQSIMDAGVVNNTRYVLPLRYTLPVLIGDQAALDALGVDPNQLNEGVIGLMAETLRLGDPLFATCANPRTLHPRFFINFMHRDLMGYRTHTAVFRPRELSSYISQFQQVWQLSDLQDDGPTSPHLGAYISTGHFFTTEGYPLVLTRMDSVLDAAAIAKATDTELYILPVRSMENLLIASVTWFGAVDANCEEPALAYDFLSMFLSEDAQWELDRPRSTAGFRSGLIAEGWPVRAEGSVSHLWRSLSFQLDFYIGQEGSDWETRALSLKSIALTQNDLPASLREIDAARFPSGIDEEAAAIVSTIRTPAGNHEYAASMLASYLHTTIEDYISR